MQKLQANFDWLITILTIPQMLYEDGYFELLLGDLMNINKKKYL